MALGQVVPEKPVAITPSDSTPYVGIRALRVGSISGGAAITVRNQDGTSVLFEGVVVGEVVLTGWIDRVMSTGTTASSLVGYYTQ